MSNRAADMMGLAFPALLPLKPILVLSLRYGLPLHVTRAIRTTGT